MDCPHLIADKAGRCTECGHLIENPEFFTAQFPNWTKEQYDLEMLDAYILPALGNIPAICDLAKATWNEYDARATANEDPRCPQRPRLQNVDGLMMRIPFHLIWSEIIPPSYDKAVSLGYPSSYFKWCQFVKEHAAKEPRHKLERPN